MDIRGPTTEIFRPCDRQLFVAAEDSKRNVVVIITSTRDEGTECKGFGRD
jgi:hypothetical protein